MNVPMRWTMQPEREYSPEERLIAWGWLTAFVFPLVGFVIGTILLTRNRVGSGVGMMILAIVIACAAANMMASGA
jgi:hypothetical protein